MQRLDRPLVLEPQPRPRQATLVEALDEDASAVGASPHGGVLARLGGTWVEPLEAVVARVDELVHADHPPGLLGAAAGDTADERVAPGEPSQQLAGAIGHRRRAGLVDDRGQRAVDVAEDPGGGGLGAERFEQPVELRCPCGGGIHGI